MAEHFLYKHRVCREGKAYTYWYEAWWERGDKGRKFRKRALYNPNGEPITKEREAVLALDRRSNGQSSDVCSPITVDEFIPEFQSYLRDKGKKERSIALYVYDLMKAKERLPRHIQDWQLSDIERYLNGLSISPVTKTKYAKSISRFLSVARKLGKLKGNPLEGFEFTAYRPQIVPYTEKQIKKLIETARELQECFDKPYYDFIIVAFQLNLRLNEYANLRAKYLDIKQGTYTICKDDTFEPKHGRERTIRIPKSSSDILTRLVEQLPDGCEYIFHKDGKRHHHFTRDFVNHIFKAAGIDGDLHQIRKTGASYRLACGEPLQNLQHDLGHWSIRETEAYLGRVHNLSDEMRKFFGTWGR